jgi:hypothetical protein
MKSPEVWPRWNVDETDGPVSDRWTCIRPMDLYQTDGPVSDRWTCIRPMDLYQTDGPRWTTLSTTLDGWLQTRPGWLQTCPGSTPDHSRALEQFLNFVQFLK